VCGDHHSCRQGKVGRGLALVSDLPAEAMIQTGERTALSCLVKPLSDKINRAFREE
jgi:HlyD family secretion protein